MKLSPPMPRTRRTVLAWLGVAALALAGGAGRALGQAQVSQENAKYQDSPKDGKKCAGCKHFKPPDGCRLVAGKISANGWCRLWVKA